MLKIAVVDDELYTLKYLKETISNILENRKVLFNLKTFNSGIDFIKGYEKNNFDVVFLDIIMPNFDGFSCAKEVRSLNQNVIIIFITSENTLVYDSFDFRPFNFICKTSLKYIEAKLNNVIVRLLEYRKQFDSLILDLSHGEIKSIQISNIIYASSEKNYICFHIDNENDFYHRQKISEIEEMLLNYDFIRVHKQFLINLRRIKNLDISNNKIFMSNDVAVSLGREYKKIFIDKHREYLRSLV